MITLNPDGTATLRFADGAEERIENPLASDYRHLVRTWDELTSAIEDYRLEVRNLQVERQEAVTADPSSPDSFRLSQEFRQASSKLVEMTQDRNVAWLAEMLATLQGWELPRVNGLADPAGLDGAKMPATVYDPQWPIELIGHWTLRPSVPGAQ